MSPSDIQQALSIASLLAALGASIYTWLTTRSRVNETQIAALSDKAAEHDRRLDKVENDLRHLPDKDLTHRMEMTLTKMQGDMAVLNERLQPVSAIAERLQEFLLEQAKR
ncbi:DUF2730 family protein [Kaistia sp. MMO-174]|uniref:DUF2730 family protein n=1 Tax=Kaistia sp. MMO-174 TaxID=3081256 RepID=UPI00301B19D5